MHPTGQAALSVAVVQNVEKRERVEDEGVLRKLLRLLARRDLRGQFALYLAALGH